MIIPPQILHSNVSEEGFTNIHIHIADATFRFKEPMMISDDSGGHIFNAFKDSFYFFNSEIDSKQLVMGALGNLIVNYVIAFRHVKPIRGIVDEIKSDIMQNFSDCDYKIEKYLGVVTGETIIGANFVKDFFAGIRDVIGGRSGSYEKVLREAKNTSMEEMQERAMKLGANAIIGIDVDYETIGQNNSMLMVAVSGTAVVI